VIVLVAVPDPQADRMKLEMMRMTCIRKRFLMGMV